MPRSPHETGGSRGPGRPRFVTPWGYVRNLLDERFEQDRRELTRYLEVAAPIAMEADRLYESWREAVAEPIQDGQKAANRSAVYWWRVTDGLRRFQRLSPPRCAERYHRIFAEALEKASEGADTAKSGFRSNKFSEVSRGLGFLDRHVELMAEAEQELGRLVRKYKLVSE